MTPEEFRKAGYRIIDWIADYRAGIESRPVMAKTAPGEVKAMLPPSPPQQPESFDAILQRPRSRRAARASRTGSIRGSSATSRRAARSPVCLVITSAPASA